MATSGSEHPSVTLVKDALAAGGAAQTSIDGLRILPGAVTTAVAAAEAVGVAVGQIANSLVFDAGGEPLLVLTSGAHRVDTGRRGGLCGVSDDVRRSPAAPRPMWPEQLAE